MASPERIDLERQICVVCEVIERDFSEGKNFVKLWSREHRSFVNLGFSLFPNCGEVVMLII